MQVILAPLKILPSFQFIREMLIVGLDGAIGLASFFVVVGIYVSITVSEVFHHFGRSVTDRHGNGEIPVFLDVFHRRDIYFVGDIVFRGFR